MRRRGLIRVTAAGSAVERPLAREVGLNQLARAYSTWLSQCGLIPGHVQLIAESEGMHMLQLCGVPSWRAAVQQKAG